MSPPVHRQHPHPLIVFAPCQAFVPYPWASSHILSGLGIILCIKHRLFQSATLVTFATISDSICEGYLAVQLGTSTYIRQPLPTAPEPESGLALIAGSFNPPHQGHLDARLAAELGTAMSPNWGFPKMGVPEYPNSRMVNHGKSCEHYLNWMITGGTMGILQFAKTRSTRFSQPCSGNGALPLCQVPASPCDHWSQSQQEVWRQSVWATRALSGHAEGNWPHKCGRDHCVLQRYFQLFDTVFLDFGFWHSLGLSFPFLAGTSVWEGVPDQRWSYIWKHAQQHGAKVMYRGLRSFRKDGASEKCLELQNLGETLGSLRSGKWWKTPWCRKWNEVNLILDRWEMDVWWCLNFGSRFGLATRKDWPIGWPWSMVRFGKPTQEYQRSTSAWPCPSDSHCIHPSRSKVAQNCWPQNRWVKTHRFDGPLRWPGGPFLSP